jgi:hypothetical protein
LEVKDGTATLALTIDYTVAYSSNINVGTATATITGVGNYTGTKSANFTINPKPQTITFNPAIPLNIETQNGVYTLVASTEDGITVKFRIDGSTAAASIDASINTLLHLAQTGTVTVTAYIDDSNYSATEVSRVITIVSSNTDVGSISVSNTTEEGTDFYVAYCGTNTVTIEITPDETGAKVLYNGVQVSSIALDVSRADIYTVNYEIEASAGNKMQYSLKVESKFEFDEITGMKFNNVLFVNNNSSNNGGYNFEYYEWFKNGQSIGTGQYYTAGDNRSDILDATAQYSVTITTDDGKVLHTCDGTIILQSTSLHAYPNPAHRGEPVTLKYSAPQTPDNAVIRIFNLSGKLINTQQLTGYETKVSLPSTSGMYLITVNGETVKVIVE